MNSIERELSFEYVRSSGPGGQNVNKVATAVQLRFDVTRSPSLSEEVKARLVKLAGKRVSADGILVIEAKRYRAQEQESLRRAGAVLRVAQKSQPEAQDAQADESHARVKRTAARGKAKTRGNQTKQAGKRLVIDRHEPRAQSEKLPLVFQIKILII